MSDEQIRQLLLDARPPVDDRDQARRRIAARVRAVRVRRRVLAGVAVVVGVSATLMLSGLDRGVDVPVIAPDRPEAPVEVSTACGEYEVDPTTADYIRRWTEGRVDTDSGPCLLVAVPGPAPQFDTTPLGVEQPFRALPPETTVRYHEGEIFATAPGAEPPESYPYVLLGSNPLLDTDGDLEPSTRFLWWLVGPPPGGSQDHDVVWWCEGNGVYMGGGCGPAAEGVRGRSQHQEGGSMTSEIGAFVAPETAAAELRLDGEAVAWQRPRGRMVWFALDQPLPPTTTVVAYNAQGDVIEEYTE